MCGSRIAAGRAFGLSNNRYAACVLAQSPHASLIGEAGDLANCSAVLRKRRSRRLSHRSAPANSLATHSTDSVPASMIACTFPENVGLLPPPGAPLGGMSGGSV